MYIYAITSGEFANRLFDHIVDPLIAVMAFIALLYFIITIIKFILNTDNPKKRNDLLKNILWSVVGLFIIFSIWTIFSFVGRLTETKTLDDAQRQGVEFGSYRLIDNR